MPLARALALAAVLLVASPAYAGAATPILGAPAATASDAGAWATRQGASWTFVTLTELYWQLASERGVRPEVAYAQAAKETGFGRFGGLIDAGFRNPCGLKTRAGGANHDPRAHARFPSWRVGVTAHLDHLALYAGAPGYPLASTPDPRHFPFLWRRARTVEALGGRWAPSRDYGRSVARLVRSLLS